MHNFSFTFIKSKSLSQQKWPQQLYYINSWTLKTILVLNDGWLINHHMQLTNILEKKKYSWTSLLCYSYNWEILRIIHLSWNLIWFYKKYDSAQNMPSSTYIVAVISRDNVVNSTFYILVKLKHKEHHQFVIRGYY